MCAREREEGGGRERERMRERESVCVSSFAMTIGSLKLKVSFAEHSLFYRALLQKRPIILRSLLRPVAHFLGQPLYVRVCLRERVCGCVSVCAKEKEKASE